MSLLRTTEIQYRIFRWTGMAFNDFNTRPIRILYRLYDLSLTASYITFDIICLNEVVEKSTGKEYQVMLLNIVSVLLCFGVVVKRVFLIGWKSSVKELIERQRADLENPMVKNFKATPFIMERHHQSYLVYNKGLYIFGGLTAIFFTAPAFVNFLRELPIPFPIEYEAEPTTFSVILFWELFLIFVAYINFLAYDMVIWGFLMITAIRQEIVRKKWEVFARTFPSTKFGKYIRGYEDYPEEEEDDCEVLDEKDLMARKYQNTDGFMRNEKELIRRTFLLVKENSIYFQEINEEMKMVDRIYKLQLLIHMVGGALLLGIMIVFVLLGGFNTSYAYRTTMFALCACTDLFIFSYYGTKIEEERQAMATAVFGCPWYEMDSTTAKLFLHAMTMLRIKLQFTAGGFTSIDLETYLSLMKLSYNLLAVLRSSE